MASISNAKTSRSVTGSNGTIHGNGEGHALTSGSSSDRLAGHKRKRTSSSSTTTTTITTRNSPFRIKVGTVIAWRDSPASRTSSSTAALCFQLVKEEEGTPSTDQTPTTTTIKTIDLSSLVPVWTDPVPPRDYGYNLIGKRIRCFFPNTQHNKRRVLEGEIIHFEMVEEVEEHEQNPPPPPPYTVHVLIDQNMMEHFPSLKRTDDDPKNNKDHKTLTPKQRKHQQLEQRIRGINKIAVEIKLQNPKNKGGKASVKSGLKWAIQKRVPLQLFYHKRNRKRTTILDKKKKDDDEEEDKKGTAGSDPKDEIVSPIDAVSATTNWDKTTANANESQTAINKSSLNGGNVVDSDAATRGDKDPGKNRKRRKGGDIEPAQCRKSATKAASSGPVVRHVGDGNDSAEQQVANWRWLAGNYHTLLLSSSWNNMGTKTLDSWSPEFLSMGVVGIVVNVAGSTSSSSLATVTMRRMFLPEHTLIGRQSYHDRNFVFDDYDNDVANPWLLQVPVEQCVIIGQNLWRLDRSAGKSNKTIPADDLVVTHFYSFTQNIFVPGFVSQEKLSDERNEPASSSNASEREKLVKCCHRCRTVHDAVIDCGREDCPLLPPGSHEPVHWCERCLRPFLLKNEDRLPCCRRICDCALCISYWGSDGQDNLFVSEMSAAKTAVFSENLFICSADILRKTEPLAFGLPFDVLDVSRLPVPLGKPIKRIRLRVSNKGSAKSKLARKIRGASGKVAKADSRKKASTTPEPVKQEAIVIREDYSIFKPSCARTLGYDPHRSLTRQYPSHSDVTIKPEMVRNWREVQSRNTRLITEPSREADGTGSKANSRAARANQRRLLKEITSFLPSAGSGIMIDTLASREPQLRFDRSGIHAWGVFADEDICAGEMIVEYRGEIISHAVAERREIEYENAKIGSDYMFRIDGSYVCDATKQGNVARFINASCDPNCYTKIINVDGAKRIVIYAKKDIPAGDELCYDYKFPLEYDETKRIPCHCGSRECHGFMNWVRCSILLVDLFDDKVLTLKSFF
jgi:histone-lysine N-methyltransferase SETD1